MGRYLATIRILVNPRPLHLLVLLLVASISQAQGVVLHVTKAQMLQAPTTSFSPPPYWIDSASIAGVWQDVTLPNATVPGLPTRGAKSSQSPAATLITWYRIQLRDGFSALRQQNYVYISRWKTDGTIAVYADSRIVYQSHANLLWNGSNSPLWIALDTTADVVPPREILVRIQHLQDTGGALSSVWIGPDSMLGWRYRMRSWLQTQLPLMSSAAFLAVGIFTLFVWFQRRQDRLYLFVFAMAVVSYVRTLHYYAGSRELSIPDDWFGWLTVNSMFWLITVVHLFLSHLHGRKQPWLTGLLVGLAAANSLLTFPALPSAPDATLISPVTYMGVLVLGSVAFSRGFHHSWLIGSREGMLLAGWSLLCFVAGIYDWLLQMNLVSIEGAFLTPYSNCGVFFIFTYIMYRRYIGAIHDVEQSNVNLAERLREREAELATSYARLRDVERRQTLSQERQRLMQDMHDGLGSSLTTALRVVEGGRIEEHEVAEVLKGCIDDLKLAIDSMEPLEADLLLLLATLRYRLQARLESSGIRLRWDVTDTPPLDWLDPRNGLHILRIAQEAFTNIIKHTRATEIRVATAVAGEHVLVTITDDGSGFDLQQALTKGGKGLANQLRRAEAIGGQVHWANVAAGGTCFTLSLPLTRKTA